MAYKRTRTGRMSTASRRKYQRSFYRARATSLGMRPMRTGRRSITNGLKAYTFVRRSAITTAAGANAASFGFIGAQLSALVNASDITNMFDEYRILKVKVKMWLAGDPGAGTFGAPAPNTSYNPILYYARDYNDFAAPVSLANMQEYANCKMKRFQPNGFINFSFKPNTLATTGGVAEKPDFSPWVQNVNITHCGYKFAIDYLPTNQVCYFQLTYIYQCRNPK